MPPNPLIIFIILTMRYIYIFVEYYKLIFLVLIQIFNYSWPLESLSSVAVTYTHFQVGKIIIKYYIYKYLIPEVWKPNASKIGEGNNYDVFW